MDFAIRLAEKQDAGSFFLVSLRAHTKTYYDRLIPEAFKNEFYNHYAWSYDSEVVFTAAILRKIAHPDWRVAVAVQDARIVGYTIAHIQKGGGLLLRGLFVDPDVQTRGIGSALFKTSLTWSVSGKPIELSVIENNSIARGVYEKFGFKVTASKNKDFRGTYEVKWRLAALNKADESGCIDESELSKAKNTAYGGVMRSMRGTDELPWFKDLAYYNRSVDMWRHLESIRGDDLKFTFVLLGKANAANINHERILYETKTVV